MSFSRLDTSVMYSFRLNHVPRVPVWDLFPVCATFYPGPLGFGGPGLGFLLYFLGANPFPGGMWGLWRCINLGGPAPGFGGQ